MSEKDHICADWMIPTGRDTSECLMCMKAKTEPHTCADWMFATSPGKHECMKCAEARQTENVIAEIRRLQRHAAMTRGEQAYRELPRYVVRKCGEILKAMEGRDG